jgi:LysR family glycine cleavage system transcriptional activator
MPVWSAARPFAIEHPADVLAYPLLGPDHRPEFWREWLEGVGLEAVGRPRGIDALLLYERALGGAGVAIGIEPLVSDLLRQGRLRGLDAHRLRSARSFFLLAGAAPPTRAARQFGEWLRSEAKL